MASKEGLELFEYSEQFVSTLKLVEDEIILAMPIVAKHKNVEDCDPDARKWLQQSEHLPVEEKRRNPFASLKNLKI